MNKLIATPIDHIRNDYALMWQKDHLKSVIRALNSSADIKLKKLVLEEKRIFTITGQMPERHKKLMHNFWSLVDAVGITDWKDVIVEQARRIIQEIENPDARLIEHLRYFVNEQPRNIKVITGLIESLKQSDNRRTAQLARDIRLDYYEECLEGLVATDSVKGGILSQLDAMDE